MTISYRLNKNIIDRAAAQLTWELNTIKSSVSIINKERKINGKSLVGILCGRLEDKDEIKIIIDKDEDLNKIKECFNKIGTEI